jgi:hypothetical protein
MLTKVLRGKLLDVLKAQGLQAAEPRRCTWPLPVQPRDTGTPRAALRQQRCDLLAGHADASQNVRPSGTALESARLE